MSKKYNYLIFNDNYGTLLPVVNGSTANNYYNCSGYIREPSTHVFLSIFRKTKARVD